MGLKQLHWIWSIYFMGLKTVYTSAWPLFFKYIVSIIQKAYATFSHTIAYHSKNYRVLVTKEIHINIAKEVYTTSDRSIGLSSRTCLKDALVVQKFAYSRNIYTDQENWTMQLFLHLQKVLNATKKWRKEGLCLLGNCRYASVHRMELLLSHTNLHALHPWIFNGNN